MSDDRCTSEFAGERCERLSGHMGTHEALFPGADYSTEWSTSEQDEPATNTSPITSPLRGRRGLVRYCWQDDGTNRCHHPLGHAGRHSWESEAATGQCPGAWGTCTLQEGHGGMHTASHHALARANRVTVPASPRTGPCPSTVRTPWPGTWLLRCSLEIDWLGGHLGHEAEHEQVGPDGHRYTWREVITSPDPYAPPGAPPGAAVAAEPEATVAACGHLSMSGRSCTLPAEPAHARHHDGVDSWSRADLRPETRAQQAARDYAGWDHPLPRAEPQTAPESWRIPEAGEPQPKDDGFWRAMLTRNIGMPQGATGADIRNNLFLDRQVQPRGRHERCASTHDVSDSDWPWERECWLSHGHAGPHRYRPLV